MKESVLKNFAIFTGKHLCWSLLNKVAGLQACKIINKRLRHRCFQDTYFKTPILKIIWEQLVLKVKLNLSKVCKPSRMWLKRIGKYIFFSKHSGCLNGCF